MAHLTQQQIEQFTHEGFIRIDQAFPKEIADECRAILWKDTGCSPNDPRTWTRPVIRLGYYVQEPFHKAVSSPILHAAYDDLVGKGRWQRPGGLGTFPVRFPSPDDPGDTGWHVDAAFAGKNSRPDDYLSWQVNVHSRGRALLMLFLLSDVSDLDAPTRIRVGSHLDVARILAPAGDEGMTIVELATAANKDATIATRREVLATGAAGTVYLCHPFLLHAGQRHRGTEPRFLAQPPLMAATEFQLHRSDHQYSPVERAIRLGLGL